MTKPLNTLLSTVALLVSASLAQAQTAPAPAAAPVPVPALIRIVVPAAPGASTDVIARRIAHQLGPRLGTNVIVDNRAGGSGMIGSTAVVKGPKDGSMLLFTSVSMITTAATTRIVPFDVIKDLVPIAMPGAGPLVLAVSSKSDIKTPADLLAAARAKPEQLTHGTAGVGTTAHLAVEMLNDAAKIQIKHIPYKGASLAVTDTVAGTIDMTVAVNTTFAAQLHSGRMRAIAVTSEQPSPAFPNLPTLASVVPGYSAELWTGLFAPAGTAPALIQRLNREINEIAKSKEMVDLMHSDGATPLTLTPEETAQRVRDSYATWKRVASARHITLE